MRVLVIGGSGHVGRITLPFLAERHELTVYDLHPPATEGVAFVAGDVQDISGLAAACVGQDAVLYMAMGGGKPWSGDRNISGPGRAACFDVNVKGVYMAFWAAHDAGISQAVYTSSMSVYHDIDHRGKDRAYFVDEDMPPDSRNPYGLTKRLGEEVCRAACRQWTMDINALRLCFPVPDDEWREKTVAGEPTLRTAASDVANALLAALEFRAGFQAFTICGDYEQKLMSLKKAKQLLHWEPLARPSESPAAASE